MKIIKSWLREWVDFDISFLELGERLTMRGIEMEGIETLNPLFPKVIGAKVLETSPHPNAEKLHKVTVFDGHRSHHLVCGDLSVKKGETVALALPGAKVGEFEIATRKVRGEISEGMLCSEQELGIGLEHQGVMRLENHFLPGRPLHEILPLQDEVLELSITPNRSDCLSVLGIAREVSSILGNPLKHPFDGDLNLNQFPSEDRVHIDNLEDCFQYHGALVDQVKISVSSFVTKRRLELCGIRSINSIVDLTNLILLEIGQPMHAFDFSRLAGGKIVVRRGRSGESILALDGQKYAVSQDELVIADTHQPVAIAGIMGGELSGVKLDTNTLFFESAQFNPSLVRRGSKKLGIKSESSYRFERGVDRDAVPLALKLACKHMTLQGSSIRYVTSGKHHKQFEPVRITLSAQECNKVLGTAMDDAFVSQSLSSLGIPQTGKQEFTIPGFRLDLERPIDLIEEVARVAGYDKLPEIPERPELVYVPESDMARTEDYLRDIMVKSGLNEVVNYTFVHEKECVDYSPVFPKGEYLLKIKNPLSPEFSTMRNAIIPGLIRNASASLNHQIPEVRIFEVGPVFPGLTPEQDVLKLSRMRVAFLIGGHREPDIWGEKPRELNYFDLKGVLEVVLEHFGVSGSVTLAQTNKEMSMYVVTAGSKNIGVITRYESGRMLGFKIKTAIYAAEIDIETMLNLQQGLKSEIMPPARFPKITEDVSFIVKQSVTHEQIMSVIKNSQTPDLIEVKVFDLFKGEGIPSGYKSLAYSMTYRNPLRTLTQEEVLDQHQNIKNALIHQLAIEIR